MKSICIKYQLLQCLFAKFLLALAVLAPTMAWAQDQLVLTYVASDVTDSFSGEGPEKLLDGLSSTKWCSKQENANGEFVPFYIIVKSNTCSVLKRYDFFEAWDAGAYEEREWYSWVVYGTNDNPLAEYAEWSEIDKRTVRMFDGFAGRKQFDIPGNTRAYKYYKVQVNAVYGKNKNDGCYIQMMADMKFYGEALDERYDGAATWINPTVSYFSPEISFAGQGADKVVDCDVATKWCGPLDHGEMPTIELDLCRDTKINRYFFYTGNDVLNNDKNRNPSSWVMRAKRNADDPWTEISRVDTDDLPTEAYAKTKDFYIDEKYLDNYYRYVKFTILRATKGTIYELGELCLMGFQCTPHHYADGRAICDRCGNMKEHEHTYDMYNVCTQCDYEKEIPLSFSHIESYGGDENEGADKAIDGITNNDWRGIMPEEDKPYVVMQSEGNTKLSSYHLYTGTVVCTGDEHGFDIQNPVTNRNPKEWKLYAKQNLNDEWTEISHVADADIVRFNSSKSKEFYIDEPFRNNYYKYFKFEILKVEKGDMFAIGEFCPIGNPCVHECEAGSVVCVRCGGLVEHEHSYVDGVCTKCDREQGAILTFTVSDSQGENASRYEGPEKAIDNITTNKWCGKFKTGVSSYVELKHEKKTKLLHYYLYTGNDVIYYETNRNPKEWKLYAKENEDAPWIEISHITDANLTTEHSTRSNDYDISEAFLNTYYKYFKYEIVKAENGSVFEIGELCFSGTACPRSHSYAEEGTGICPECGDLIDETTALSPVQTVSNEKTEYYDITGRQMARLQKGINIIKTKEGEMRKVMIK